MDIRTSRTGTQLVLTLTGRMDGTGASQVTAAIQQNLADHDTVLIFDMAGVEYLSSAGLRVFQEITRKMADRNGKIAVCSVRDFVRKLLMFGGFFRILAEYPDPDAALKGTAPAAVPAAGEIMMTGPGWALAAVPGSARAGTLFVTGSLSSVQEGNFSASDIREVRVPARGYFTGIGAMSGTAREASGLAGEMVQAGGMVSWIPADGSRNPDFFTTRDLASSGMKTFSFFSASYSGPFSDILRISTESPEGMTLAMVYEAIFRYLKNQHREFSGVCAVTLKATIGGLGSSDIRTSLLAAAVGNAGKGPAFMPGGKTVTEYPLSGTVIERASAIDISPRYAGDTLISVGYGIDMALARVSIPAQDLPRILYTGARTPDTGLFLYSRGMVFRNLPWDASRPFEEEIGPALAKGEFVAIHNLLKITTVRSAVAGILPVATIRDGE